MFINTEYMRRPYSHYNRKNDFSVVVPIEPPYLFCIVFGVFVTLVAPETHNFFCSITRKVNQRNFNNWSCSRNKMIQRRMSRNKGVLSPGVSKCFEVGSRHWKSRRL